MRYKYRVFFASLLSILLIYIIFVSCIDIFAFNRNFYQYEYHQLHTAEKLGMSNTSLYVASDTLLDYLKDYRDTIDVKVSVNDTTREVFNTREKEHMKDVKGLYRSAILIRNVSILIFISLFALLYYDNRKELKEVITYAYTKVCILFLFLLLALVLYAISDFTSFWTNFHKVFFTNDLWLLNPETSLMINMFPETFFTHLVFLIAFAFFSILMGLFIYSRRYIKRVQESVIQ